MELWVIYQTFPKITLSFVFLTWEKYFDHCPYQSNCVILEAFINSQISLTGQVIIISIDYINQPYILYGKCVMDMVKPSIKTQDLLLLLSG